MQGKYKDNCWKNNQHWLWVKYPIISQIDYAECGHAEKQRHDIGEKQIEYHQRDYDQGNLLGLAFNKFFIHYPVYPISGKNICSQKNTKICNIINLYCWQCKANHHSYYNGNDEMHYHQSWYLTVLHLFHHFFTVFHVEQEIKYQHQNSKDCQINRSV